MGVTSRLVTIERIKRDGKTLDVTTEGGYTVMLKPLEFYDRVKGGPERVIRLLKPGRQLLLWEGVNSLYEVDLGVKPSDRIEWRGTEPLELKLGNSFVNIWSAVWGPDIAKGRLKRNKVRRR